MANSSIILLIKREKSNIFSVLFKRIFHCCVYFHCNLLTSTKILTVFMQIEFVLHLSGSHATFLAPHMQPHLTSSSSFMLEQFDFTPHLRSRHTESQSFSIFCSFFIIFELFSHTLPLVFVLIKSCLALIKS